MRERLWPAILGGWALAAIVLCLVSGPAIVRLRFPDPDDAMRLLEVRDWMAGQSWWDVAQHRLNGGNFPMHWSRLVDVPLALVLAVSDLVATPPVADRIAMTTVPLVTLFATMAGVATLTNRLAGHEQARFALLLAPLSIPMIYQLRPMRIDHHGWQIALVIGAVVALADAPTARRGATAGLALAALVTVSMEGLPIAAVILGATALRWVIDPYRRAVLMAAISTLFLAALALHIVTRGPTMWLASCDAVSPAWLAALGVAALGVVAAAWRTPPTASARLAAMLACAAAAAATLTAISPDCARGPFASLDPLVRALWYDRVTEGLPLWRQSLDWAIITIALPVVGLGGAALMWRSSDGERRARWTFLLTVLAPVTVLACLVNRCGATANALAIPGAASILLLLLTRARAIPNSGRRTLATAGALVAASPGLAAAALLGCVGLEVPEVAGAGGIRRVPCERFDQVRALAALPSGTVFVPLDVTPDLIATTSHRAISGGYHRNAEAMHRVLAAFVGPPAAAERIIRASGADYVAGCPGLNETRLYDAVGPGGLWARLERGERFSWLQPVPITGSPMLAWRVLPQRQGTARTVTVVAP